MRVQIEVNVNTDKIAERVTNDKFGLFMAQQWKRLIDPFTPKNTGQLMGLIGNTVDIRPFEIQYNAEKDGYYYSNSVYYGTNLNFQKKNPYATHHWDKAAEQAGKKEDLARTLTQALESGQY